MRVNTKYRCGKLMRKSMRKRCKKRWIKVLTYGCPNDIITKLIREKTILKNQKKNKKKNKKLLTRVNNYDILDKLLRTTEMIEADSEKEK